MDQYKCSKIARQKCPEREICGEGTYTGIDCECAKFNEKCLPTKQRNIISELRKENDDLKKALEQMSEYMGENDDCPAAAFGAEIWPECNGETGACGDNRTVAECWKKYFTQKTDLGEKT